MSFDEQVRELAVGKRASCARTFGAEEVALHEGLTGDRASAPGAVPLGLLGGMISELLGTQLPGRGTNWLKQKYHFEGTARVGETITATVEVTRVRTDKALINLASLGTAADGRVIFRGESLVLVRELELIG